MRRLRWWLLCHLRRLQAAMSEGERACFGASVSAPPDADTTVPLPATTANEPGEDGRYTKAMYAEYLGRLLNARVVGRQSYDEWVKWNRYMDASDGVREVDIRPDT